MYVVGFDSTGCLQLYAEVGYGLYAAAHVTLSVSNRNRMISFILKKLDRHERTVRKVQCDALSAIRSN